MPATTASPAATLGEGPDVLVGHEFGVDGSR